MIRYSPKELVNQENKKNKELTKLQNQKFLKEKCILVNGKYYYKSDVEQKILTLIKKYY